MNVYILEKSWHGTDIDILEVFLSKEMAEEEMKTYRAEGDRDIMWIDEWEITEKINSGNKDG